MDSNKSKSNVASGVAVSSSPLSLFTHDGAIVYRLGHKVFILVSGVRFPVALPKFCGVSHGVSKGSHDPEENAKMRGLMQAATKP